MLERRCAQCRRVIPKPSKTQQFCDPDCRYAWTRTRLSRRPDGVFNAFVYERWRDSGLTVSAFAREIGVAGSRIRSILAGKRPTDDTVAALHGVYGTAVPAAESWTDQLRKKARRNIREYFPEPGSEMFAENRRKSAAKLRGRSMDPTAIQRSVETKRATGALAREADRLRELGPRDRTRVLRSLLGYLHRFPEPKWPTVRKWAIEVGAVHSWPSEAVLRLWRPQLEKRKLWPRGGAPTKQARWDLLATLVKQRADPSAAFWEMAYAAILELEGEHAPQSAEDLRQAWKIYRQRFGMNARPGGKKLPPGG
jgi:hypothetical protein